MGKKMKLVRLKVLKKNRRIFRHLQKIRIIKKKLKKIKIIIYQILIVIVLITIMLNLQQPLKNKKTIYQPIMMAISAALEIILKEKKLSGNRNGLFILMYLSFQKKFY